jgi:hypothetical protein
MQTGKHVSCQTQTGLRAGEELFLILFVESFFYQAEKSAPNNVLVMPFIPQQAILAHKNTRKEVHRSFLTKYALFSKGNKARRPIWSSPSSPLLGGFQA